MIETSSWPPDLASWQPEEQPFYLEFFGETSPLLDESYAEVVLPGGTDPTTVRDAPVYEYWWTLGHPGTVEEHHHWYSPGSKAHVPWEAVADPAVRVYLYFPISAGWRVKEIMATLKYLAPAPEQRSWFEQARKDLSVVQPVLGGASELGGFVPGAATASKWLQAVSKLQVSSVPQAGDMDWSVGKVTFGSKHGVMQGVMWTLPRSVFQRLGGCLTGSLALSFIPATRQVASPDAGVPDASSPDASSPDAGAPDRAKALAHAVVYSQGGTRYWIPGEPPDGHGFVELAISPRSLGRDRSAAAGTTA